MVYVLRKSGRDGKDIQAWLGHSDVTTTLKIYSHVLGGDMERLGKGMDHLIFQGEKSADFSHLRDIYGTFAGHKIKIT